MVRALNPQYQVGREGFEPLVVHLTYFIDNGFTIRREEHDPSFLSVTRAGVEPAGSRRFELRRFASLRTVPRSSVSRTQRPRWDSNPRSPG
jgi:hypothetical protein